MEVYPDLLEVLYGRRVIVFNASYDRRVWNTAVRRLGARGALAGELPRWECAMRQYARYVGEPSKRASYQKVYPAAAARILRGERRAKRTTSRASKNDSKAPRAARSLEKFMAAALRTALTLSPSVPLSRHLSIRLSSLRWPMEGSIAARRLIQRHRLLAIDPRLRRPT